MNIAEKFILVLALFTMTTLIVTVYMLLSIGN